jgi:thiol-disulfide isomerase/thioredoxin
MRNYRFVLYVLVCLLLVDLPELYSQTRKVAPFKIVLADGKTFTSQDLPKGKPVVIIYFSPECEDCQKLTGELIRNIDDYWGITFTMVTYLPVSALGQFVSKFNLKKYPNFYVGTEGSTFIVRYYYNVIDFPFVIVHNKNGDLVKIFKTEESLKELPSLLKTL